MVGDSITWGYGSKNPAQDSWPVQFSRILNNDDKYEVLNLGANGRTMMKTGDYPYWKENDYKIALSSKANYLILMLGTNDAKTYQYNQTEYIDDYIEMVNVF